MSWKEKKGRYADVKCKGKEEKEGWGEEWIDN